MEKKRLFLLIIVFKCCVGLIYLTFRKEQMFPVEKISTVSIEKIFSPLETIKSKLENQYDRSDVSSFYQLAEKEFSLGLKCSRQSRQPSNVSQKVEPRRNKFYSFTIKNSDLCGNETIDLLIFIISKSENYKTRDAIRRTWASKRKFLSFPSIELRFIFLIDFDEKLSKNILLENELFRDIVQVELPQQYSLVTHRVLSLVEWSFRFCPSAKFVFKTDDDIFINLYLLLKFVAPLIGKNEDRSFRPSSMSIYGYRHVRPTVFRSANDPVGIRYVVTEEEFPCTVYPDFLSGFGYLIPKKARDALLFASFQDRQIPFRISDVYLT